MMSPTAVPIIRRLKCSLYTYIHLAAAHLLVQDVFPLEACTASRFRVDPLFELDCKNFEVLKNREDSSDFDDF